MGWTKLAALVAGGLALAGAAQAQTVGERHLATVSPTAVYRDAEHKDRLRVTVWYPADPAAKEERIDIGPPAQPLFLVGAVAPEAAFADARRRPLILLSHGFGGTARMMGWFGVALARHGYVVVAVDHPGNNGLDPMTKPAAILFWDRPEDLKAALRAVEADPTISPHLDPARVGVSGFSAGGFTALAAAGAQVDVDHYRAFCAANPTDGVCSPQKELAMSQAEGLRLFVSPELAPEVRHAGDDHSLPQVRAAFAMAPALVQALQPASLARMKVPVAILAGDADTVAPPRTNAEVAAKSIPGAKLVELPGVGHYDFLSVCTPAGDAAVPLCPTRTPRAGTHQTAIDMATSFFDRTLGRP